MDEPHDISEFFSYPKFKEKFEERYKDKDKCNVNKWLTMVHVVLRGGLNNSFIRENEEGDANIETVWTNRSGGAYPADLSYVLFTQHCIERDGEHHIEYLIRAFLCNVVQVDAVPQIEEFSHTHSYNVGNIGNSYIHILQLPMKLEGDQYLEETEAFMNVLLSYIKSLSKDIEQEDREDASNETEQNV